MKQERYVIIGKITVGFGFMVPGLVLVAQILNLITQTGAQYPLLLESGLIVCIVFGVSAIPIMWSIALYDLLEETSS